MSFLQRLKGKGVDPSTIEKKDKEEEALKGVIQLEVDLLETDSQIVIFAPVPGTDIDDINVSVEGDNDIVVIHGTRKRPEDVVSEGEGNADEETEENEGGKDKGGADAVKKLDQTKAGGLQGKFFSEDIHWGEFYRKIILPEAVDVKGAQVKIKDGVLVIQLPLVTQVAAEKHSLKIVKVNE